MKLLLNCICAFLLAIIWNLSDYSPKAFERTNKLLFFVLSIAVAILLCGYALWVSYCRERLSLKGGSIKWAKAKYYFSSIVVVLIVHLGLIFFLSLASGIHPRPFKNYLSGHLPFLLVILITYVDLLFVRPALRIGVFQQQIKERETTMAKTYMLPTELPMDLFILFSFLQDKVGEEPVIVDAQVMVMNIVFISSSATSKYVYLSNGEIRRDDQIIVKLKKLGLMGWMVKLSGRISVNMMLIKYPVERAHTGIELQEEVVNAMLKRRTKVELNRLSASGPGLRGEKIKDFVANKQRLQYQGWDSWVSLR